MQNRSILAPALSAIAVLVACTACAPSEPAPTETVTQTVVPTPSSTPTEEPIDLADPSSWTIDFAGVGPLTLGGSIAAERASMTAFVDDSDPAVCTLAVFDGSAENVPTIWAEPETDLDTTKELVVTGLGEPAPFVAGSPTTEAGIGVGATEGELVAAYPEIVPTQGPGPDSTSYSLAGGSGGYINFTVDTAKLVESIAVSNSPDIPYEYCG
jgi:hypothetical protein